MAKVNIFSLSNFKRKPVHGFCKMFFILLIYFNVHLNKHHLSIEAQYFSANYIQLGKI